MEIDIKETLKEKFQESKGILDCVATSIQKDFEEVKAIQSQVIAMKKQNPDLNYKGAMNELLRAQEIMYMFTLKDQEVRRQMILTGEYYTLCKLNNVDLELTKEEETDLEELLKNISTIFVVDPKKNIIAVSDMQKYEMLVRGAKSIAQTDERLQEVFYSPQFSEEPPKQAAKETEPATETETEAPKAAEQENTEESKTEE